LEGVVLLDYALMFNHRMAGLNDVPIGMRTDLLILPMGQLHASEARVVGALAQEGHEGSISAVRLGALVEPVVRGTEEPLGFCEFLLPNPHGRNFSVRTRIKRLW
jgi:hypothetical protein